MTSTKPYLIRAFYEWIADNDHTPYLVVNANYPKVKVPTQHIEKGQIILNIAMRATKDLHLGNDQITFNATFSGVETSLYVPVESVMAIYAKENGKGMVFSAEKEYEHFENNLDGSNTSPDDFDKNDNGSDKPRGKNSKKKSHLTIVK